MNRFLLALGLVASVVVGGPAWALPSVYEGFIYPNDGNPLEGRTGGYGWGGPWGELAGDTTTFQFLPSATETSLTLPNLPFTPTGNHVVADGPGTGGNNNFIARPLASGFDLGEDRTFYASFLMSKTQSFADPLPGANNQEFDLYSGGSVLLRMGSTSGNAFFIGAASNVVPDFTFDPAQTYFVVVKVDALADADDTASVVIYDSTETIPATDPGTFDQFATLSSSAVFDTVRLWIGTNADGAFDELRFGNTWADVTSANPNYILGDFDQSGGISPSDYQTLASNLYTGTTYEQGDIDFNGRVDLTDFAIFRDIYTAAGLVLPPGAPGVAVPEPATWLALAGAAVAAPVWLRRRKTA